MSYAVQKKSGVELNRLYIEDKGVHDWYRFVLSFPPHLVRQYIEKFNLNRFHKVLDPFCGTGTTLVENKKNGIPSFGIEANPVVKMAASAKVNWDINPTELLNHSNFIAKEYIKREKQFSGDYNRLDEVKEKLIIKNSISELPLHKTLLLIEVINENLDNTLREIELTALAKQLVYSYSNLCFGPEVGVSRKKKNDVQVIELWLEQISKMADDLNSVNQNKSVEAEVFLGDSRSIKEILPTNSVDAVITSPPYPNEKDYSRTTRLESVLLGFLNEKGDLRKNKEKLLRSNTKNIYKDDSDEDWIKYNKNVMDLADKIENRRIELGKTSGFEKLYHKVVRNYFGGMAKHLEELKFILRPGAQLAYVVGDQCSYFRIPIKTGELLADIAYQHGYSVSGIELFRTRLSTVTKEQLREEVVLLKFKG